MRMRGGIKMKKMLVSIFVGVLIGAFVGFTGGASASSIVIAVDSPPRT